MVLDLNSYWEVTKSMRNSKETGILTIAKTLFGKVVPQETISNEASQTELKLSCKTNSNRVKLCSSHSFAFACIALLFLAALPTAFAISENITLQGKLTNSSGQALSGDYTFLFELFDANIGGTALWTETHGLTVTNGIFAANLGSNNSTQYLTTADFNAERWVQITIDGTTQVPRVKLNSQPSAFIAKKAMTLDLNAFMQFSDFNSWYASAFNPTFSGDSNFVNVGVSGGIFGNKFFIADNNGETTDGLNWINTIDQNNYLEIGGTIRIGRIANTWADGALGITRIEAMDGENDSLTISSKGTGNVTVGYAAGTGGFAVYDGGITNYLGTNWDTGDPVLTTNINKNLSIQRYLGVNSWAEPTSPLMVNGDSNLSGNVDVYGNLTITGTNGTTTDAPDVLTAIGGTGGIGGSSGRRGGSIILTTGAGGSAAPTATADGGDIELTTGAGGTGGDYGNIYMVKDGGFVGIGTDTPSVELDVTGSLNVTGDSNFVNVGVSQNGYFGSLGVDSLNLNSNVISDSTGAISFANNGLTTTGQISSPQYLFGAILGDFVLKDVAGTPGVYTGAGDLIWGFEGGEFILPLGIGANNYEFSSTTADFKDNDLTTTGSITVTGDSNFLGDLMITGKSFASTHIDHTPGWEGSSQEALEQLLQVKTGKDGEIDHSSLPEFTRVKLPYTKPGKESNTEAKGIKPMQAMAMTTETVSADATDVDEVTTGRDLGASITLLFEAVKALNENIESGESAEVSSEIEFLKHENKELKEENRLFKEEMCARDSSYSWCEEEEEQVEEEPKEEKPVKEDSLAEEPLAEEEPPVEECTVACSTDRECDDADANTLDVCNNDGGCDSNCTNLPVVFNARAILNTWFGLAG